MQQFETEEQQVEAIKRFWQEHGKAIIFGAVIGLGGLWGWRYVSQQQIMAKENASISFSEVAEKENVSPSDFLAVADEHASTGYSSLATLQAAKSAVEAGDYDQAISILSALSTDKNDKDIAMIASLRLARLHIQQQQPQAALSALESVTNNAYVGQVKELQGDAFVLSKDPEQARQAYVAAVAAMPNNRLVKMKLDNLATTMMYQASEE